jgi:hypothetical protein
VFVWILDRKYIVKICVLSSFSHKSGETWQSYGILPLISLTCRLLGSEDDAGGTLSFLFFWAVLADFQIAMLNSGCRCRERATNQSELG